VVLGAGVLGAAQNAREAQRRVDEYKRDELVKCVPTLPPFVLVVNQSRGSGTMSPKTLHVVLPAHAATAPGRCGCSDVTQQKTPTAAVRLRGDGRGDNQVNTG
jgi:hypothetical protein